METKELSVHFCGLLLNADDSITNIHLQHGYLFEEYDAAKMIDELVKIIGLDLTMQSSVSDQESHLILIHHFINHDTNKLYFISNKFTEVFQKTEIDGMKKYKATAQRSSSTWGGRFGNKLNLFYVNQLIQKLNIFKEGNIRMPVTLFYAKDEDDYILFELGGLFPKALSLRNRTCFSLKGNEVNYCQEFIDSVSLPFKDKQLQLAFNNFEHSYQTDQPNVSFLLLMISLEALFNKGTSQIRYTISRYLAGLISNDIEEGHRLFKRMKKLYDVRSKLVHNGTDVEQDVVNELRGLVRRSIHEWIYAQKDKDELLNLLDSHGFGHRPWRDT